MFDWIWLPAKDSSILENTALVVTLVRDFLFLVILVIVVIALLVVFAKIRQLLNTVQETANTVKETSESVQEAVNTVSEKMVEPTVSNAGVMRGIGGLFGFIQGMRRRRKGER